MIPELCTAGEHLATVLEQENQTLRAMDLPGAGALLADKTRAIDAFLAAQKQAEGVASDTALHRRASAMAARLARLAAENRRLLDRAIKVQGRVLDVIARAVPPAAVAGYRPGVAAGALVRPAPIALSARA